MSFREFSLELIESRFGLAILQTEDSAVVEVVAVVPSDLLKAVLAEDLPLALSIHTEKARSEFIVAPVLAEVRRQLKKRVSLFSGTDFNVDFDQGLNGTCDFLLSLSPQQLMIQAPAVVIVEAKRDDIGAGLPQCMAGMVAARLFNRRRGQDIPRVYGAVTTGSLWVFLRLEGDTIFVDRRECPIGELARVVGTLVGMVQPQETVARVSA